MWPACLPFTQWISQELVGLHCKADGQSHIFPNLSSEKATTEGSSTFYIQPLITTFFETTLAFCQHRGWGHCTSTFPSASVKWYVMKL